MRLLILTLIVLLTACTPTETPPVDPDEPFSGTVDVSITPRNLVVERGERSQHSVSIKVIDPENNLDQAVAFLNVLRYTSEDRTRYEPGLDNFTDSQISNDIFQIVLTGDQLREGVQTDISYLVKAGAIPGEYNINLQLFADGITDPNDVNSNNRIAITNTIFEVR